MQIWSDTYATIKLVDDNMEKFKEMGKKKGLCISTDKKNSLNFTYKIISCKSKRVKSKIKREEHPLPHGTSGGSWSINRKTIGGDGLQTVKSIIHHLNKLLE